MTSETSPRSKDAEEESAALLPGQEEAPTPFPSFPGLDDPPRSHSRSSVSNAPPLPRNDSDLPLRLYTSGSATVSKSSSPAPRPPAQRRQSSMSKPAAGGSKTPRTSNRVRFDLASTPTIELKSWEDGADRVARGGRANGPMSPINPRAWREARRNATGKGTGRGWLRGLGFGRKEEEPAAAPSQANGHARNGEEWLEEEDPLNPGGDSDGEYSPSSRDSSQRARLLEGMEAGPVRAALDDEDENRGIEAIMRPGTRKGMGSAFMNMANSIIGAGIIGQPYAIRQAGLVTGILLLIGLTVMVDWTIQMIVLNSKLSGTDSFQTTMEHCFGKKGLIAISIAQWAFAFGGMLAFCVIIGDTIPHVLIAIFPSLPEHDVLWIFADRRVIIIIFVMGISFPLSLYRDIAKLAKASSLALISMVVIIVTVITQGAQIDPELRGNFQGSLVIKSGIFQAIGVISFAFVCHHNSLLIYGSLQKPTLDRFARVTHFSTGASMFACVIMAMTGFLVFGDKTQGNILNNFPSDNTMVNVARLCFGLNMLTTLPLEAFVCREVMLTYFHPTIEGNGATTPLKLHVTYTTGLVLASVLLSLLTCDLGAVFEIIGATSAAALAFAFPPLCWLHLTGRARRASGDTTFDAARRRMYWKRWMARATVVFGVSVAVISTVLAVIKIAQGGNGDAKC